MLLKYPHHLNLPVGFCNARISVTVKYRVWLSLVCEAKLGLAIAENFSIQCFYKEVKKFGDELLTILLPLYSIISDY